MFQSAIAFLETQGVPTPFATAIIRLLLGSICGGLIGLEREMKGRPAGLKTFHSFVWVQRLVTGDERRSSTLMWQIRRVTLLVWRRRSSVELASLVQVPS